MSEKEMSHPNHRFIVSREGVALEYQPHEWANDDHASRCMDRFAGGEVGAMLERREILLAHAFVCNALITMVKEGALVCVRDLWFFLAPAEVGAELPTACEAPPS